MLRHAALHCIALRYPGVLWELGSDGQGRTVCMGVHGLFGR